MKVAVVGSRTFNDYNKLKTTLDSIGISIIISGGAVGADSLAERYASDMNIPTIIFKPDWKTHGRSAGIIRNKDIVDSCDILVAFWDGESRGTLNSIERANASGKRVIVVNF